MDDQELLDAVLSKRDSCGASTKYRGAVTVELLRAALRAHGVATSPRDVFIAGVTHEIDLIVPRPGAAPVDGVLYRPEDVLLAMEVKNNGVFAESACDSIRKCFQSIQSARAGIACAYVALMERKNYRHAIEEERLGFPAFTLFRYSGSRQRIEYKRTDGEWQRLLNHIITITSASSETRETKVLAEQGISS